jgi:hypothetical protein
MTSSRSRITAGSVRLSLLALLALAFLAGPASAQTPHPAANAVGCGSISGGTNACTYSVGGRSPGAGQVMVLGFIGPNGGETLTSIADTYYGTGTCNLGLTVCGNWTQFSAGCGSWSNATISFSNLQVCFYWAKTGTNSGSETVTPAFSSGGTAKLIYLTSWSGADVDATAANPEDTSIYAANGACAGGISTGSFTLGTANDVLLSLTPYDYALEIIQSPNARGRERARRNVRRVRGVGVSARRECGAAIPVANWLPVPIHCRTEELCRIPILDERRRSTVGVMPVSTVVIVEPSIDSATTPLHEPQGAPIWLTDIVFTIDGSTVATITTHLPTTNTVLEAVMVGEGLGATCQTQIGWYYVEADK